MEKQKLVTTVQYNKMDLELRQDKKSDKMIMSMEQLSEALGYKNKRDFKNILEQCPELQELKYSFLMKVENLENGIIKKRQMRFFTEEGIMEASFLAGTSKAKEFRGFIKEKFIDLKTGKGALTNIMTPEQATKYILQIEESYGKILNLLETKQVHSDSLYEQLVKIGKRTELEVEKLENRINNMDNKIFDLSMDVKGLKDEFNILATDVNMIKKDMNTLKNESSETRKDMKEIKEKIGLWKS